MAFTTRSLGLALAVLSACSGSQRTSRDVLLILDSTLSVPEELDRVTLRLTDATGEHEYPKDEPSLPTTFVLHPRGAPQNVVIEVSAALSGTTVLEIRRVLASVPDDLRLLRLCLAASCVGTECPDGESCYSGACDNEVLEPGHLETWNGAIPPSDPRGCSAPSPPPDAGPPPDCACQNKSGDLNGRGGVQIDDTIIVLRCMDERSLSAPCDCTTTGTCEDADFNCDGHVDDYDEVLALCFYDSTTGCYCDTVSQP